MECSNKELTAKVKSGSDPFDKLRTGKQNPPRLQGEKMEEHSCPVCNSAICSKILKYRYHIVLLLIVISILINLRMSFHDGSVLALSKRVLVDKDIFPVYFSTGLDQFLEQVAPEGNVVLKFEGFGKLKRESDVDAPVLIYFRSVYRLYPRKVFAVPLDVVVNTGEDLTKKPFNPDLKWMQEHGVRKEITLVRDSQGRIYNRIKDIKAIKK